MALFQKSVVNKYLKQQDNAIVAKAYKKFVKYFHNPTLLVVSTGLLTWFLKDKSENLKLQREKLIEEKRQNYEKILEPMIRVFSGVKGNKNETQKAIKQMQSFDYKRTAFQLMLFGSDDVVNAYNSGDNGINGEFHVNFKTLRIDKWNKLVNNKFKIVYEVNNKILTEWRENKILTK